MRKPHGYRLKSADGKVREEFLARTLGSPFPWMQADAMIKLGGFMRPHIRIYPSVRLALGKEGEPRTVLLERLPEYILEAHRAGATETSELLEHVRRLVDQNRRTLAKQSLHNAPEPMLERLAAHRSSKQHAPSELDDWHAKQELSQRLDALLPRAGLSPREAEVLSLQCEGLSHAAIASKLGIKKGAVKQYTNRIKKKFQRAAHS